MIPMSDRFKPKPDSSAYKEYTNPANFVTWHEGWLITSRAQGMGRLFDPHYDVNSALTAQEWLTYWHMAAWMYEVMFKLVKTING